MNKLFCKSCGKEIEENSSFCKYCGTKLNYQEATDDTDHINIDKTPIVKRVTKNKKVFIVSCIVLCLGVVGIGYGISTLLSSEDELSEEYYDEPSKQNDAYSQYYTPAKNAIEKLHSMLKDPSSLKVLGMYSDESNGYKTILIYYSGTNSFGGRIVSYCSYNTNSYKLTQDDTDKVLYQSVELITKGNPKNYSDGDYFIYDIDTINDYVESLN